MEAPLHTANLPLEAMECQGAAKNLPDAQEGISAPADNTPHKANHTHPWPGSSKVLPDLPQKNDPCLKQSNMEVNGIMESQNGLGGKQS